MKKALASLAAASFLLTGVAMAATPKPHTSHMATPKPHKTPKPTPKPHKTPKPKATHKPN